MSCTVCCGGGTTTCSNCPGNVAALQWCMSTAGITNNGIFCGGNHCGDFNGSFILTKVSDCVWTAGSGGCTNCGGSALWTLEYNTTTKVFQLFNKCGAIWQAASFNCVGTNNMVFQSGAPECNGWPGTITLTPC